MEAKFSGFKSRSSWLERPNFHLPLFAGYDLKSAGGLDLAFRVIEGYQTASWQGFLRTPTGQNPPQWSRDEENLFLVGASEENQEQGQFTKRWQQAQQAEAAFWRGWRQNILYKHVGLGEFWEDVVSKTGGPLPTGRVLDIGCGPVSVLNFCRPEGMIPIGLDPLGATYARESLIESRADLQPVPIIALPAEKLPFADQSLDHLICFNVLDHVSDAPAVLAEMGRVLKSGGSLRVYVHTFARWIRKFLFFDRPHTYHWHHAEFMALMERAGFRIEMDLEEPKTFDLPKNLFARLAHFPYEVATRVAATSYFLLRKP